MDSIRKLRIKHEDGTYSNSIPIGASSDDIFMTSGGTLTDSMSDVEEAIIALDKTNDTQGESIDELVKSVSSNTIAIQNQKDVNEKQETKMENFEKALAQEKIYVFDNVHAMKNANNLKAGMYCITKGYYTPNDGGGAEYIIRNVAPAGHYETLNNEKFAEFINDTSKKFNVLKLGIKRNVNESQNITLANIIAKSSNGDVLFFPSGSYYFNEKIILKHRIGIEGEILSTGERDSAFNGARLVFDILTTPSSVYTLLDCTQNNKTSIKNLYILSNSYEISCDRSLQSTNSSKVDTFAEIIKTPNIEGIRLTSYGSQLQNVIINGCSKLGVFVGKYNLLENVRIYNCNYGFYLENDNTMNDCNCFTCNVGIGIEGPINLINNFRADEVKHGIWCYSGNNNITNFNIDYALYNAIQLEGANNNYITGNIGRVGTAYAEKGNNTPIESCYIGLIGSDYNTIIINISKRNTKDSLPEILNPCYSIVTRNTCKGNMYELTGEPKFLEFTKEKLTVNQLKNLLTIEYGTNSDTIKYYDFIYSFNETTNAYNNNSIKCSNHLIKYSDGEIFDKSVNAGNNTSISFDMADAGNHTFLVMITKNGTSNRGLYLLGYSTATATLVTETIVELSGVTFTRNGTTITINGVSAWSSAQIISNTNFITN